MATKRIVCLASSWKPGGRCIAGKELIGGVPGGWIRPVGERKGDEVSYQELKYAGGGEPRVLDVIDIPLCAAKPHLHQTENWLIDASKRWVRAGRFPVGQLDSVVDPCDLLWINGYQTHNGLNDRIHASLASTISDSLKLIPPSRVRLRVGAPYGERQVRACFRYHDVDYAILVTDPLINDQYVNGPEGDYAISRCYFTVSLAQQFRDAYCYKLVAAVIHNT